MAEVKILPADMSLKNKLGNANLDQLLSAEVMNSAQQIITQSSDEFLAESVAELGRLKQMAPRFTKDGLDTSLLVEFAEVAFALKTKAGLGGYDLVATIAKSLQEKLETAQENPDNLPSPTIINWYLSSLERLLELKIKGMGGTVGEAILAELTKLTPHKSN